MNQSANEVKLHLVQQRFPNDNLNLDQSIEVIEVWRRRGKGRGRGRGRGRGKERGGREGEREIMIMCTFVNAEFYNSMFLLIMHIHSPSVSSNRANATKGMLVLPAVPAGTQSLENLEALDHHPWIRQMAHQWTEDGVAFDSTSMRDLSRSSHW